MEDFTIEIVDWFSGVFQFKCQTNLISCYFLCRSQHKFSSKEALFFFYMFNKPFFNPDNQLFNGMLKTGIEIIECN